MGWPRDLQSVLSRIQPVDQILAKQAQEHLDTLTKPRGSLGRLEELARRYVAITREFKPQLQKKAVFVFAADHGVAQAGVSAYPKEVTAQMVYNFLNGGAAINVIARAVGAEVKIVDIGVDADFPAGLALCSKKIRHGTRNFLVEPAMTPEEVMQALLIGIELANEAKAAGVDLIATGEMGIGNTTASSAMLAALLNEDPANVTGRGTGVSDETYAQKIHVVAEALRSHANGLNDPVQVLQTLGGLEIAGLCGLLLGAASCRLPAVVDGFIASTAALVAIRLAPTTKDYLFFSHCSAEQGHRLLLDRLGVQPLLDLGLRLGEGTGAALAMHLIESSIRIYNEMATFEGAGVAARIATETRS
ncbi:MAG: nicotinate-nucleotide--dimethylbenzimidazole phosphoribosyltransferase [Acidobacteria bacterium]|nr:nicotinate-nucleotide--dimethylbenzimidazole phosphoribosyltransferase [Acidobacteriota bacterium]MCI0623142.1 nicotinate-nucleotide--dimethylbenzimidazole phosphoribosyltransferase [Acidobacteriota bacterium]MCI0723396.1 nicotinate-nucleotide--dimethylbenzimidazole phosphoribosyltransferase [Acidobacteriota bacterium]